MLHTRFLLGINLWFLNIYRLRGIEKQRSKRYWEVQQESDYIRNTHTRNHTRMRRTVILALPSDPRDLPSHAPGGNPWRRNRQRMKILRSSRPPPRRPPPPTPPSSQTAAHLPVMRWSHAVTAMNTTVMSLPRRRRHPRMSTVMQTCPCSSDWHWWVHSVGVIWKIMENWEWLKMYQTICLLCRIA